MFRINLGNLDNTINLRIDKRLFEFLNQRSLALHISMSQYVRLLIEKEYFECLQEDESNENK